MREFFRHPIRLYRALTPELRGMVLITLATLGFAGMHGVIRHLSVGLHPFEVAFFRNLFGLLALTPFFLRHGFGILKTDRLGLHGLRGAMQVCGMLMFFSALSLSPLAKVSAMSFTAPLFATLGAVLVLGERIRARRVTALVVGFIGAVIVLQPGVVAIDLGAILVLASSAIWAGAMLVIKHLSKTESSLTLTAYMGLVMTPLSLIVAAFVWRWPEPEDYLWFCLMGAFGTLAHLAFAEAFREADITVVLPLDFTRLIWASVLGFLVFGEVPALWTWVGGTVIFASTVYIAYREARLKAQRATRPQEEARRPESS